ncbi:MAG: branched-chain amino acid ABC transporter permease, partial [Actinomycetota bacterium]
MGALATAFFNENTLRFGFLGVASGALYALVALGLVLTYRASGVLNFSVGSMGAISAYEFFALRDSGPQPIFGETTKIYWGLALVIALLLGIVIGLFTHFLVMVVLRKVSLLGKLIATLGLMTFGQGFVGVIYDTRLRTPQTFFPTDPTKLPFTKNVYIPAERYILIGLVLLVAAVLRLIYSKTLFGLATTGVAENRRVASASGYSPTIIEMVNFGVAGLLAAGAAILLSPIVGLQLSVLTLMVLPALAAALVGRFSSFTVTVVGALVIGMLQALVSYFQGDIAGW